MDPERGRAVAGEGRVVVLGAGGLLGTHLVEELRAVGARVTPFDRASCDVAQREAVVERTRGAAVIYNCAAYTNVDGAETDEEEAYRANALGAENAALAARAHGARLVHVSTDFVFDGALTRPYDELDAPRPLSIYGRSKWAGEVLAQAVDQPGGGSVVIARVQGLYGRGGRNFASRLRELVAARKPLKLDAERRVQPTWARAAARQLLRLGAEGGPGVYHVSCSGATTWAGFARHLAARLGVLPAWEEVPSAALGAPASRPPNCLFERRLLRLRGLDQMPGWEAALEGYLADCDDAAVGAARGQEKGEVR